MKTKRSIWTSVTGGLASAAPLLVSCCKSGACIGVCASPFASLFGVSAAGLASSALVGVIEPLLIAVSAVSFTVSYYRLYVLPKQACATNACACDTSPHERRQLRINKFIFWLGLFLSLSVLSYFEYNKYHQARQGLSQAASCDSGGNAACGAPATVQGGETQDGTACDSTSACCSTAAEDASAVQKSH